MLRKTRKLVVLPMLILAMTFTSIISNAQEEMTQHNVGVSEICPDAKGASRPKKVWDIKKKGAYSFSGSANNITIYTSYKFKGKTNYTVKVENTGKYPITVKAKTLIKTYGSTKISAGKTGSFSFSNIKSDTEFYITFEGSEFSGSVK